MNVYEIAFLSTALSIFLNYIIGKPGSQFSPYEIFSSYTFYLAKRRLKKLRVYYDYKSQYNLSQKSASLLKQTQNKQDFMTIVYNAADPFFTWERMIGMCSICTGFWVSLVTGFCFTQNVVDLLIIIVTSHLLLRIINKILL